MKTPGSSVLLYSSATAEPGEFTDPADSNTYRQFKILDSTMMRSLSEQVDTLGDMEQEGKTDAGKTLLVMLLIPAISQHLSG